MFRITAKKKNMATSDTAKILKAFRFDPSTVGQLQNFAASTHKTESEIVRNAVNQYLTTVPNNAPKA